MRKITLTILSVFLFSIAGFAKQRNENDAFKLAGSFLQQSPISSMRAPSALNKLQLIYTCKTENKTTVTAPLFYVYNIGENNGFVIVSGDDRAKTILGYSDKGAFDYNSIPVNFKNWLNNYKQELEVLSLTPENSSTIQLSTINNSVSSKAKSAVQAVAPLLENIKWNQSSPYNDMCPVINNPSPGARAATGCVATAMAQVMKYYEWPVTGTGSNSYTTATLGIPLSVNFSATTYDWLNMTDTYGSSSTQPQKDAVATLMYHCGVATNMDYNTESGTSINAMGYALKTYFGYDTNIQQNVRNYYTRAEWIDILKGEIDASRPVLYSGNNTSGGGHMFVCDGYDPNYLFHFNWGWGGLSNGYFEITALNPGDIGIGGGNGSGYNLNQAILKGVQKPNPLSEASYVIYTDTLMESSVASTTRSGHFDIDIFNVYNYGMNTFTGKIGLGLYNGSTLVSVIDEGNVTLNPNYGWGNLTFSNIFVPSQVANGIYKLYIIYATGTNWQIVRGRIGTPNYLTTTVTSTQVQFSTDNSVYPQLTLNSLSVTGNLYQNKTGRFNVNITNNGGEYNSNVVVYLQSTSNPSNNQTVNIEPLNIATAETVAKQYYGAISVAPGEYYYAVLVDSDNNPNSIDYTVLGTPLTVNVLAEPTLPYSLSMPTLMSFPNNSYVPKNNAVLTASITNTGGYFENKMIAFIFPAGGGNSLGYIGYQQIIVDAGETIPVTFTGSIDLPLGNYKIAVYYHNGTSWINVTPTSNSVIDFTLGDIIWTGKNERMSDSPEIYPNPVIENLHVRTHEIIENINIFDLSGRQLMNLQPHNTEMIIPASTLESGVYILQITEKDKKTRNMKFVKK